MISKVNQNILKAGVVGLGVGMRHIDAYERSKYSTPIMACDCDSAKLNELLTKHPEVRITKHPEILISDSEIDIISIASFDKYHFEQIMLAIENDKHVFVEKPICISTEELNKIEEALDAKPHICLSSNLILRKAERFIKLRENIKIGKLGKIYYIEGDYDYGRFNKLIDGWRGTQKDYSVMLGGGIHLVDLICWLHGYQVDQVTAIGTKICSSSTKFKGYDTVLATLSFLDGSIGKISANFGSVTRHHHRLAIYGTEGTFIQSHNGAMYQFGRDANPNVINDELTYPAVDKGDSLMTFIDSIVCGGNADVKKHEVIGSMRVALAINEALRSGETTKVKFR